MQRWTFPSFRLPTGTIKTEPGITHSHRNTPSQASQVQPPTPATGTQIYRPSPLQTNMERTLRCRITKQKATNDRLRKIIANLEAKSAYFRRLKELEKEAEQLEREGKELVRREEEVKRLVEGGGGERGGCAQSLVDAKGENENGHGVWGGEANAEGGEREGSVKKEEDSSEEEREEVVGRIKRDWEDKSDDEVKDRVEVKHDFEEEAKNAQENWVEEIELLNGSAAWNWSDSRMAEEI